MHWIYYNASRVKYNDDDDDDADDDAAAAATANDDDYDARYIQSCYPKQMRSLNIYKVTKSIIVMAKFAQDNG